MPGWVHTQSLAVNRGLALQGTNLGAKALTSPLQWLWAILTHSVDKGVDTGDKWVLYA